jgi:hypothetical protein
MAAGIFFCGALHARILSVAPGGNDNNPGTMNQPWRTLARANAALQPGDTVYVRAGTYQEQIRPVRSGTIGNTIAYLVMPGEQVTIEGISTDLTVVVVSSYTTVEGFTIKNQAYLSNPGEVEYWVHLVGNGITMRRCRVVADGDAALNYGTLKALSRAILVSGQHNVVEHCYVRGQSMGVVIAGPLPRFTILRFDTVVSNGSSNIVVLSHENGSAFDRTIQGTLIEDCVIDTSWDEDNIQFEPNYLDHSRPYNNGTIIRRSRLGHAAENCLDFKGAGNVVVDNCLLYSSEGDNDGRFDGPDDSGGAGIELGAGDVSQYVILRRSVIWDNHTGVHMYDGYRYYNNVFLNNRRSYRGSNGTYSGNSFFGLEVWNRPWLQRAFVNNIIAAQPNMAAISWRMDYGSKFHINNNLYHDATGPVKFVMNVGQERPVISGINSWRDILSSYAGYAYLGGKDQLSVEADPQFVNVPEYPVDFDASWNFGPREGSPAIDAGRPVTTALRNETNSISITVDDARFFCDGFGVTDGDLIRIGAGAPVRITAIDTLTNVMTLDSPRSWSSGDGVHLAYEGSAPDIGAVETGTGAPDPLAQSSGTLRFSTIQRQVYDNTIVTDSLQLLLQGSSLKALQFRLVTAGRTILRRISRGVHLPERDWWFFSSMKRGPVQEDGSVSDTCSVVILGAGAANLPAGTYENLAVFSYDVVNTPSATPVTTTFRLIDVVGALAEGSNAGTVAGSAQTVSIRNGVSAGDVNGDDRVDILDVVLVVDHILLSALLPPDQLQRADIAPWPGGDGVVDARDLAVLLDIVLVRAYPDGMRPYSLSVNSIPDHLEKLSERSTELHNAVRMSFNGGRVRIRLRNTVPVRGMQWKIQGLSVDSTSRMIAPIFESNPWISDSIGARGLSYSSQAGTLSPGDWLIGDFAATGRSAMGPLNAEISVVCADPKRIERTVVQIDSEENTGIPAGFHLDQNFPNPFNPVTVIRFALPEPAHTRLTVYTLLGEEVAMLLNEPLNAGAHRVSFDAQGLSSGVYFYRLEAGLNIATKKMLLVH